MGERKDELQIAIQKLLTVIEANESFDRFGIAQAWLAHKGKALAMSRELGMPAEQVERAVARLRSKYESQFAAVENARRRSPRRVRYFKSKMKAAADTKFYLDRGGTRFEADYKSRTIGNDRLTLRATLSEDTNPSAVSQHLISLLEAMNEYHVAGGGEGFTVEDFELFMAPAEVLA